MLRIQREEIHATAPGPVTFRLAGRLGGGEVAILLESVEPVLASGRPVELDLAGLRFLEDPGARQLSALARRGVTLRGATAYAHALLHALENER